MKVIFLDFDGVLNSFKEYTNPDIPSTLWTPEMLKEHGIALEISKIYVQRLNRITHATGAKLVISSSWRKGYLADYADVIEYLHEQGVKGFVIGRTPWGPEYKCRGDCIQAWLDEHEDEPIESYVILDDFADMGPLIDRLVKTHHAVGLTDALAEQAIKMLGE